MSERQSSFLRRLAGVVSGSFLLGRGRRLYERNRQHWALPLSKVGKIECGLYMILQDYAAGRFPPTFADQAQAYENEINYNVNLPGMSFEEVQRNHMQKPFGDARLFNHYTRKYARLLQVVEQLGLKPGARMLELGCGSGWMAEFLALTGYAVWGTTISHYDVELADKRIQSLKEKGEFGELRFLVCPMESVADAVGAEQRFDAVYVFEALHHAYDWRAALRSAYPVLEPGGWMILASEPNLMHTFISYRVARLSNTHEIGMSRRKIFDEFKRIGFKSWKALRPRPNNFVTPHWIVAQK